MSGIKLNPEKVKKIRQLYKSGGLTQEILGERFGVSKYMISLIVRRLVWKKV